MNHTYKSKFFVFMLFCALCISSHTQLKAQFINIPDANFRAKLQTLYPACFGGVGGLQLDATCSAVTSATSLNVSSPFGTPVSQQIADLTGIGAFTSLQTLDCDNNQLTSLPTLPTSLISLACGSNALTNLPSLPASLLFLHCFQNQLTNLPTLPASLRSLVCASNQLTSLPALPASLQGFNCSDNQFTSLPALPASLQDLFCSGNLLTNLPALPTSLINLGCDNNQLTSLPTLPPSLIILYCGNNQLTSLPALPASLTDLRCFVNQLTSLPALPANLINLNCSNNLLTSLPTLPASLKYLYCNNNQLTNLLALPNGLLQLQVQNNQLTNLPALPASLLQLQVQNNQLTSLPTLPASLTDLRCFVNQLTSLPALPASLIYLNCSDNLLDFADLEAINPRPSFFYFATPQRYTILPATVSVAIGGTLAINGTIGGALNVYKWFKDNVLIVGATNATFTKASFVAADAGIYRCEVTSTFVGAGTTTGVIISSSNVTVCLAITFNNTTVTNGVVGTTYTLNASTTNASSYSVSPALPAGLVISSSTGAISGTPTLPVASATYTVTATQGTCSATQGYTFAINCPIIVISPATFVSGMLGASYSQTLTQTGLTGTPAWFVSLGTLPTGLSIAITTGIISGTPTIVGTFSFIISVINGTGCIQTKVYSIVVYSIVVCPTLVFGTTTASGATVGTAYSLNAGVMGNTATVIYSLSSVLPDGLSLNTATGTISGTPTASVASATYTVTATQGTCSNMQNYTIAVVCPTLVFSTTTASGATVGAVYSLNTGVTGNTATVVYSVNPALPAGLSLNTATGDISGTPTASALSSTYTVTATQGSCSITQSYILVINQNPTTTALDNSLANEVKVSPNPSSGDFNVDFGSINMAKSSVRVYNAQGKTVYTSENNSNLMVIPLDNLASGIYLMEINSTKGRILKRLAKK